MAELKEYQQVRILQLLRPASEYDSWGCNQRPPLVGDVGTVIEILHTPVVPDRYVVESSGADGVTNWLDDFVAEELELVDR